MSEIKNCISCNNQSFLEFNKIGTDYFKCSFCGSLFSDPLSNDNMVGGGFEEERNTSQNKERIERFRYICGGVFGENKILDFGCGHGMLYRDMLNENILAFGYDKFNPDFNKIEIRPKFNIISAIEVVEHLHHPFAELDTINDLLVMGGIFYIETSFTDIAEEENIELKEFFYVNPTVGHSSIFSHLGLDILMLRKGFIPLIHFNRNARIFKKVKQLKK